MSTTDLTRLFTPTSVAVIGASERPGSLGRRVVENLAEHSKLAGTLHLVNATKTEILGRPCVARVADIGAPVDVAVVAIPADGVVEAVRECATAAIPFAVILTSGFSEVDEEGARRQEDLARIAAQTGIRVVGPNCPGLTNVRDHIGMTFSPAFPVDLTPGPIGLATQGGGLGRNVLQGAARGFGTGLWASMGNAADLDVPDVISHFAGDPQISTIAVLLEGIPDGPAFLASIGRAAAANKPVVALKIGRSEYGKRAIESHTAAMAGEADINSAVFTQYGVVEVDDIDELIDVASLLGRATPPADAGVAIWGMSGGAVTLCADAVGQAGLRLVDLDESTTRALAELLPSFAAIGNPVDITATGLAEPELIHESLRILAADPEVDIVLVPYPLDYGADSVPVADALVAMAAQSPTPVLPIWMSDRRGPAYTLLTDAGLTSIHSISKAVAAVSRWAAHGRWRAATRPPTPLLLTAAASAAPAPQVRTEVEAKAWLAESGIPVPRGRLTITAADAAAAVAELPGAAVLKIVSPDLAHKSDVGGVQVGILGEENTNLAYQAIVDSVGKLAPDADIHGVLVEEMIDDVALEMIVGVHVDPVFGHILTVGAGGVLVELMGDVQRRLLPIDTESARHMLSQLRIAPLLEGHRGRPRLDIDALAGLLADVSTLVAAHPEINQLELNPVVLRAAGAEGATVVAVDAVVEVTR